MINFVVGGVRSEDATELLYARQSIVTHAKAHQLQAIDLVHIDFKSKHLSSVDTIGTTLMSPAY